jgi:hypothetical protein
MGSSASVVQDSAPVEIKALMEICDVQLARILEFEHFVIDEEMSKIFKKHSALIEVVTRHTKSQLRKLYAATPAIKSPALLSLLSSHNNYAEFFKLLFNRREMIDNESISATVQADYNESVLKSILGTSSVKDILKFRALYESERRVSLSEVVKIRAKKDSHIQKFMLRVLRGDRSESEDVDIHAADQQAKEIHRAGSTLLFLI